MDIAAGLKSDHVDGLFGFAADPVSCKIKIEHPLRCEDARELSLPIISIVPRSASPPGNYNRPY